jgi:hypothetical protein
MKTKPAKKHTPKPKRATENAASRLIDQRIVVALAMQ